MKYAVIWDMDGVLVDSLEIGWKAFNEITSKKGVTFDKDYITKNLGRSLRDMVVEWNRDYNLGIDFQKFVKESWEIQLNLLPNLTPDQNLIELLDQLKTKNVEMGVGTSSQKYRAEAILDILKIKNYFNTLVTANDIAEHKPSPQIFLEVAKRLEIGPQRCIVIEDAPNGIEAARKAGMTSIGYLTQYNDRKQLKDANLIISSFKELSPSRLERIVF
jgi:beta-phosphoglucomutase